MRAIKLLLVTIFTGALFSSCSVIFEDVVDDSITLNELMSSYDLWYVDIHRTTGTGEVPFVTRAFTLSFFNGNMYANNNIAGIGFTGNGLGIVVGDYSTFGTTLETFHDVDGRHDFTVTQLSTNEIEIYDSFHNVAYILVGYQRGNFDYDRLFYENIEYFLQEYDAWERTNISATGAANAFDDEHYLQFTPENNTTFYSSHDQFGTNIGNILWDFTGSYEVFDVQGHENLKILTLNYDGGDIDEFELSVINDQLVRLYHLSSETTYDFTGRGFIQFLKNGEKAKSTVRNNGRKRTKIIRKTKERKNVK
ncbi:hypothetical protein AAON49_09850 [Pseudotenacibaculum sp. MALMAid0570]|uniref:hypothetical protein n=1 Tax=Pseudotenacibaculum sp. MALMAid0570 TaxID=3143938 RepID=UPI0032DE6A27